MVGSASSGDEAVSSSSWSARDEPISQLLALSHPLTDVEDNNVIETVRRRCADQAFADHVTDLGSAYSRAPQPTEPCQPSLSDLARRQRKGWSNPLLKGHRL